MKKYLLFIISMLCVSIGAWATDYNLNDGVVVTDDGRYTITINSATTEGAIASQISTIMTQGSPTWRNHLVIKGKINQADIDAIKGFTTFGTDACTTNNTCTYVIDFSGAEINTSATISVSDKWNGVCVPDGTDMTASYGTNVSFVLSYIDNSNIKIHLVKESGFADCKAILQDKLYKLQYHNITYTCDSSIDKTSTTFVEGKSAIESAVGSGYTVTETVAPSNDPYTVDGCTVTINMAKAGEKSFTTLLGEAKSAMTEADATQTSICTLIVQGEVSNTELEALNDANLSAVTKIDLSGATIASGSSIESIALPTPTSLTSLILPKDQTVSSTLAAKLASITSLDYAYSPSSDGTATGPNQADENNTSTYSYDPAKNTIADYVWVNKAGGLKQAFENEEQLRNSFYIKVASNVALTQTDVNFNGFTNKPTNYLFLDFSESNLTPAVAASYTVTDNIGYRIILPNGWTGDQMAVFAANPNCGSLAAVYSYNGTGNTRLDILEIKDGSYMQTALTNPRIVRSGTTAIQVVGGSYNGNVYRSFGDNLLAAINDAQSVTSIKSVKISTGGELPASSFTFTNDNIETLDLSGVNRKSDYYKGLDVSACSSLQTLNLSDANVLSVNASGATSLTSVNLTGATIELYANFSGTALATFTTNNKTIIGNSTQSGNGLDLSGTNLTSFSTAAKIGGDINLSACDNLSSIDLRQTTFANQWTNPFNSKIHIHKTNDETDTEVIEKLSDNSIHVVNGFDEANRICPYNSDNSETIAKLIDEQEYVAPDCEFSATDMTLHLEESATDGDKLVYWYAGDNQDKAVAIVTMKAESNLSTIITDNSLGNSHVKVKIIGPLKVADVQALKDINATVLDLSEATSGVSGTTIQALLADEFDGASLHTNTKFLIAPDGSTRENLINGTSLAGLSSIWSVVATEDGIAKNDVQGHALPVGYNFTSYTKKSGTLQAATVMAAASSTGDYTRTPNIGGTATSKRVYLSSISTFRDVTISGTVNAYDLCKSTTVDDYGHLKWTRPYTEAGIEPQGYALTGQDVYGPFGSCFNLTTIDLEGAKFEQTNPADNSAHDYVADMTLSYLNVLSSNATCKVVIPTDQSVQDIPADFMNGSIEIDAICIPYNIKRIRSRAFNTIDYIWTTSGTNDPEGTNTKLDNGAEYATPTGEIYATNWDGDKKVKSDFSYIDEPTGGTYTFSSNIELIESGAFANTQPHVKDVYVLNTVAPECHVDAFNTVMYLGNGGYSPVIQDGIITRDSYKNNGYWITMLHYPRQTTTPNVQRYTDPTRDYSIATGERDGKGATLYFPNQSEFIRSYVQGTYGYTWNAWDPAREFGSVKNGAFANVTLSAYNAKDQAKANTEYSNYTTGGPNHQFYTFYDVTAGGTTTKPTDLQNYYNIYWNEVSYSSTGSEDQHLYPENKDYRGWHQFTLNAYAANTTLEVEEFRSYITDNEWWTYCPTFDITREQAIILFGTDDNKIPYISKLLYVRRDYDNNVIALNFSDNLMLKKEDRANATDQHGTKDSSTGVLNILSDKPAAGDVVMSAGVPYMIKPHMPSGNVRMYQIFKNDDEYNKLVAQYQAAGKDINTLPFKPVVNETLYNAMKAAENKSGSEQMTLIQSGLYTVPVFVKGTTNENAEGSYPIEGSTYMKSTNLAYTFVGSFYKSFLPGNCYFLGWDSKKNRAKFYYNDKPDANVMRWNNETGIICPTAPGYTFTVSVASGKDPAQWKIGTPIGTKTTDTKYGIETYWLPKDDLSVYSSTGGAPALKSIQEIFASPEVKADMTNGINIVSETSNESVNAKVYSLDGQYLGNNIQSLSKGVYIVNGKKYVVK